MGLFLVKSVVWLLLICIWLCFFLFVLGLVVFRNWVMMIFMIFVGRVVVLFISILSILVMLNLIFFVICFFEVDLIFDILLNILEKRVRRRLLLLFILSKRMIFLILVRDLRIYLCCVLYGFEGLNKVGMIDVMVRLKMFWF